ncbi:MAG: leucine-rich repeat domain-containing protein [Treponema sp.]|mgnify:FL=1|nr:leucine-rich repeat domain-containing protein [Treponema sp.]
MTFHKFFKSGVLLFLFAFVSCAAFDSDSKKSSIIIPLPSSSSRSVQMENDVMQFYAIVTNSQIEADFSAISTTIFHSYLGTLKQLDPNLISERGTPGGSIKIKDLEEGTYSLFLFALDSSNNVLAQGSELSVSVSAGKSTKVSILLSWTNTTYIRFPLSDIAKFADKISELESSSSTYENIYIRFTGKFSSDGTDSTNAEITAIREALSDASLKKSYAVDFALTTGLKALKGTVDATDTYYTGAVLYGCPSIEAIVLPSSLTELGNAPFAECSSLKNIYVASGSGSFTSQSGILYSLDGTVLAAYPVGRTETSFTVPASVKKIGNSAFYGATHLESITIPATINEYRFCAFRNTANLKSIAIPDTVYRLQDYVFRDSGIESVTVGRSIITMGRVFRDCKNLSSITFADSSDWYYTNNKNGIWNGIRDGSLEPTSDNLTPVSADDLTAQNICDETGFLYRAYFYHGSLFAPSMTYDYTHIRATDMPNGFFVNKDDSGNEVIVTDNSTIDEKFSTGIVSGIWNFGGPMLVSKKNLAFKFYNTSTDASELRFNGDSITEIASDTTQIQISKLSRYVAIPTYRVNGQVTVRYGISRGSSATQDSGVIALLDQNGNMLAKNEGLTLTTSQKGFAISTPVSESITYVIVAFSRNGGGGGSLRLMGIDAPQSKSLGNLDLSESVFAYESESGIQYIGFKDSSQLYFGREGEDDSSKTHASYTISGNQVIASLNDETLVFTIMFNKEIVLVSESGESFKRYYDEISRNSSGNSSSNPSETYGDGKESSTSGQILNFSVQNLSITAEFTKVPSTWTDSEGNEHADESDAIIARAYDSNGSEVTEQITWNFQYYSLGDNLGIGWNDNIVTLYSQDGSYQLVITAYDSNNILLGSCTIYIKFYEGEISIDGI